MNTLVSFFVFLLPIILLGTVAALITRAIQRANRKPTTYATPNTGLISYKTENNPGYGYILPTDYRASHK